MDEQIDLEPTEDVKFVLVDESTELMKVLSRQLPAVIAKLLQLIPGGAAREGQLNSSIRERVEAMLDYFTWACAAECSIFLQGVCMLCDDIPMHLECRLMSAAGPGSRHDQSIIAAAMDPKSLSLPSDLQLTKRAKIDYWELYIATVKRTLQRRWDRLTQHLLRDVDLETVWVSPRAAVKGRDKADQTPRSAKMAGATPEPDVDFMCLESRVTLDSFLRESTGKITVLTGLAGSGKTLLMSHLGEQWAKNLGPIPSTYLFVLLEFRQLNHLPRPLSLSDLLFQHYVPPQGGDTAKRIIVDRLLSNPEQTCWVLDGYDEFCSTLSGTKPHKGPLDVQYSLPVANFISGLLNRQLLPGSTVLVTCRLRDIVDLEGVSDKVGQLLGWNHQEIQEYLNNFFHVKGHSNRLLTEKAADLLFSNQHLLTMSSLPALCNICCICLQYLLRGEGTCTLTNFTSRETEEGSDGGAQVPHDHALATQIDGHKERSRDIPRDGPRRKDELPSTLTQVYLTLLTALLNRNSIEGEQLNPSGCPYSPLRRHQIKLCELLHLAWKGLEEHKILFLEEEVSRDVFQFSIRTGLFTQMEFRLQDGLIVKAFSFIHLTVQEFFAALHAMTSNDISDALLKKRFSLKTRWTSKSNQRTVFTDSLCLYMCGLASSNCTSALVQLSRGSRAEFTKIWVLKRQALVLNLLKSLCNSSSLTGPKLLELCHCVQESQDQQLAKLVVGSRTTLELRNIWLLPNDIDALAFVVNSRDDNGIALDFGACSMELECLDVLSKCETIQQLSFRSRKYGDKFAEKLSSVLPELKTLKKLEFCGGSLTAVGAASLSGGLRKCAQITEINLSGNNIKNEGLKHVSDIFAHLQNLRSIELGRNNTSLAGVLCIIEKMYSCLNIDHVHADGTKKINVTSGNTDKSNETKHAQSISLLNQKWKINDMLKFVGLLTHFPILSVVDLSGGQFDETLLKTLTENLLKFNITGKLILNGSCSSVNSLPFLTALLSVCPSVRELHIRLQEPVLVSVEFNDKTIKPSKQKPKVLCLNSCNLQAANLDDLLRSLGRSSGLSVLDVSNNSLGTAGLKKLLDFLPLLSQIREINVSKNSICMEGVTMLAAALCSHDRLTQIHISQGGKDQLMLRLCSNQSVGQPQPKTLRIYDSILLPSDIVRVCGKLIQCQSPFELEFIRSFLSSKSIKSLIEMLPKMKSLQKINVTQSITSAVQALVLIDCLVHSQRVAVLELSAQNECFISLDKVKTEEASCRVTRFFLNCKDLKRLIDILKKGPRLSYLDYTSNQLGDEGVKALIDSLPDLHITRYVNLSHNRLTQQGLLHVASTLCACSKTSVVEVSLGADERCLIWFSQTESCRKTLSVKESRLQREHLVRLAEIVSVCPSLDKLELKNNSLQLEWIEELMELWKTRQTELTVSIEECWITAERAIHLFCRCLELNGNIQAIRIQQSTLHVSLGFTEPSSVSDNSADLDPTRMMATRKISLVDCLVDFNQQGSMWKVMQSCHFLTEFNYSHSSLGEWGTDLLCSLLHLLTNLTTLSLPGHVISDAAAESLAKVIPRLQSLNLSNCLWSTAAGLQLMEALEQSAGLEDLCLDSTQLSMEGMLCLARTLRSIISIHSLKLNKMTMDVNSECSSCVDLLSAMEGLTRIKEIQLDGWRLSDTGIQQLIRILPLWKELTEIILSENLISDESGDELLEALKSCTHLKQLHLSKNRLGDLSAARMAFVLPVLTQLSVLDISENSIGPYGATHLSTAIMYMKNLCKIHLTAVGTSELCDVAASLAHCPLIQDVGLGWNKCDDTVVLELAKVLPVCHKLTRIDLESNSVTLSGAEALSRSLKSCPALQVIRLWKNNISQSDAQMLNMKDQRLNFSSI